MTPMSRIRHDGAAVTPWRVPSPNGDNGGAPSANGDNGGAPSPNGDNGGAPSPNGDNGGSGRDRRGRFAKGNAGGPGNPFARRAAALRSALCRAVTDEDIQAVARDLLRRAKRGNLAAAKLLWLYTIGKPGEAVDPDTLDLHEWSIYRQTPTDGSQLQAVLGSLPIPMACEILRATLPALREARGDQLVAELDRRQAKRGQAPQRAGHHQPADHQGQA